MAATPTTSTSIPGARRRSPGPIASVVEAEPSVATRIRRRGVPRAADGSVGGLGVADGTMVPTMQGPSAVGKTVRVCRDGTVTSRDGQTGPERARAWHADSMSGNILVVEDDASVREAAAIVLERAGFSVTGVGDGDEALASLAADPPFDLVLLDLMLPSRNGYDVCREIRRSSGVPIVMLTARAEVTDVVAGLELGADDYITKPFAPAELAARIRAVLRRSSSDEAGGAEELRCSDVVVDEAAFRAYRRGEEMRLTTIEFRLLAELVRNAGRVMTREILLERVWGYDYLGDSRLVDMAVNRLRGKLGGAAGDDGHITTVRGVGYRFERG